MNAAHAAANPSNARHGSGNALPSSSRYRIASRIASGGMGSVYIGIQRGAAGFKRPVAIKRAHSYLLQDPSFRDTILTEARNASVVRHPNVVSVDDVEENDGELLLVMDYIEGTSLSHVMASKKPIDATVAVRIIIDICAALHAIHGAKNEDGEGLGLVHRDVSPQNILLGVDGVGRITDFGIAKGNRDTRGTSNNMRRGKLGYMAPEYLTASVFSERSDIFALGVVLWEAVTGRALFKDKGPVEALKLVFDGTTAPASTLVPSVPKGLDAVIRRCLAASPEARFATTRELSNALEAAVPYVGSRDDVTALVTNVAGPMLAQHRAAIHAARASIHPAYNALIEESGEYEIADGDVLACPSSSSRLVAEFVPGEADIFGSQAGTFDVTEAELYGTSELGEADLLPLDADTVFEARVPELLPPPEMSSPAAAQGQRGLHPRFVMPPAAGVPRAELARALGAPRPGRSKRSIALAVAILAVVLGGTTLLVSAGLEEPPHHHSSAR